LLSLGLVAAATACDRGCDSSAETAPEREDERDVAELPEAARPWTPAWLAAEGEKYLSDVEHRRVSMRASLDNPDNLYSRTRIASYGLGTRGWDRLPEWNPRTRALTEADLALLAADERVALGTVDPLWDGQTPTTEENWRELGRRVFFEYPLRADPDVEHGLRHPDEGRASGLSISNRAPGAVVFRDLDGRERLGITCALCHTAPEATDPSSFVEGRARRTLDYGALQLARARARGNEPEPEIARRMASWGPGRADITEDDSEDPVAIPDLWGLRHQSALTQAGTIRHIGPVALALRQETQYLYANHHRSRPPRALVWALVMYLYGLTPPAEGRGETPAGHPELVERGADVFEVHCGDCHSNEAYGGEPVRAERVGTHPGLAEGLARGTGRYRPSGLVRVRDAGPYFHDGSVATLEDVLSRARLAPQYEGPLGTGAVPGHAYGLDLGRPEQRALLSYLRTL
jgi:mono/diheme cytochrome c family protein